LLTSFSLQPLCLLSVLLTAHDWPRLVLTRLPMNNSCLSTYFSVESLCGELIKCRNSCREMFKKTWQSQRISEKTSRHGMALSGISLTPRDTMKAPSGRLQGTSMALKGVSSMPWRCLESLNGIHKMFFHIALGYAEAVKLVDSNRWDIFHDHGRKARARCEGALREIRGACRSP
jgi:hypothetical protein